MSKSREAIEFGRKTADDIEHLDPVGARAIRKCADAIERYADEFGA